MPVYIWVGTTRKDEVKRGEIEAADELAVRALLRRQGFKSLTVKKKPKDLLEYLPFLQGGVKEKSVVVFCRVFSTMINAGLPLIQCLDLLSQQESNKFFAKIIRQIKEDIEGGTSLTDALKKYPKIFDELFVNLIAAGEAGGVLDVVLERLSNYMEKAMNLKRKVKGAMTYPIVVIAIAILVIAVILVFVIPVFEDMFKSFGSALPTPTQIVVNMSRFLKGNIHWVIIALGALIYGFKRYRNTASGRKQTDSIFLKLPIFGNLLKKTAVARFTRTLGTMISSGVPILDALEIVAKTAGNVVIEEIIYEVRGSIAEGQTIAEPLSENDIFPGMVIQMIAVGEATGALDSMLEKIADFYDEEVDAAVAALTSMLEPLLMLFLGGSIGGLVIAMYLPIFGMAAAMGS